METMKDADILYTNHKKKKNKNKQITIMKKYLIFSGEAFYPKAGFGNFKGSTSSLKKAKKIVNEIIANEMNEDEWGIIIDSNTEENVYEIGNEPLSGWGLKN